MRANSKRTTSNNLLTSKRTNPETYSIEGIEDGKDTVKTKKSNRRKITPKEVYSPKSFAETRRTYHCKFNAHSKSSTLKGTQRG